jgi:predicted transcriptional regulator
MAETSILISETSLARLSELARWESRSVSDALDQAVNEQYDRKFWRAVDAGYAALRADPAAWAEVEAERTLWENTLMDGLDSSEHWTADGNVSSPAAQERAS